MSKFSNIIHEGISENKKNLTRVKIKIDPAKYKPGCNVNEIDEYTGYILQEFDDGSVEVFVPDAGLEHPIMRMLGIAVGQEKPSRYSYLKELIADALPKKGSGEDDAEEMQSLDCIHKLTDFMKHNNFADSEIIDLFKEYISETEDSKQV